MLCILLSRKSFREYGLFQVCPSFLINCDNGFRDIEHYIRKGKSCFIQEKIGPLHVFLRSFIKCEMKLLIHSQLMGTSLFVGSHYVSMPDCLAIPPLNLRRNTKYEIRNLYCPYFTEKHQGTRKYINKDIWIPTYYKQTKH